MTKEDRNEWLKKVTGRKIRANFWENGWYVVPTGERRDDGTFEGIAENGQVASWPVDFWPLWNGFKPDEHGFCWKLVEDNIDIFLK